MSDWPTLDQLEPIANWLAMRFAQKGASMSKVQQISSVLHYHCLERQGERTVINFGLLGAWLWREKKDFKDEEAVDVLCAVLRQYANRFKKLEDETKRLALYRSLTHFLTLLTWKFKVFSDKDKGEALREDLSQYGEQIQEVNDKILALREMEQSANFANLCQEIESLVEEKTKGSPFEARLAVGLTIESQEVGDESG